MSLRLLVRRVIMLCRPIFDGEDAMGRLTSTERPDLPRKERRLFLKQMAGTGALVSAAAIPAWAQENSPPPTRDLPTDQPQIAETLARYATSLKYEDLPPEVVRVAKRIIIDSIGCGIGAFSAETSQTKRASAPYRSGPSRDWLKVKNPDSPATVRHREGRW
jgi:MmgE/PrpD N-terminal domain